MKRASVRTTVDVPAGMYRRLKARAAAQGCSVRDLVLAGIRAAVLEKRKTAFKRVRFPLIVSEGPKVHLTNEQIYEHIEFP